MKKNTRSFVQLTILALSLATGQAQQAQTPQPEKSWPSQHEGEFVVHDFHFQSGETLPALRLHYTTIGKPAKDATGHTTNAVSDPPRHWRQR